MIYTTAKVTIKNFSATIKKKIILYRGDKNVEVQFEIVKNLYKQYKSEGSNVIYDLNASFGQLVIRRPNAPAAFSDIAPTKDGLIVFTIPGEMIDETTEIGEYTFQIRLYDETQTSMVTLPPVEGGIIIEEPIASEDNL